MKYPDYEPIGATSAYVDYKVHYSHISQTPVRREKKYLCRGGPSDGVRKTIIEVADTAYVLCTIPKWRRDQGDVERVLVWLPN